MDILPPIVIENPHHRMGQNLITILVLLRKLNRVLWASVPHKTQGLLMMPSIRDYWLSCLFSSWWRLSWMQSWWIKSIWALWKRIFYVMSKIGLKWKRKMNLEKYRFHHQKIFYAEEISVMAIKWSSCHIAIRIQLCNFQIKLMGPCLLEPISHENEQHIVL